MSAKDARRIRILCFKIIYQRDKIGIVEIGETLLFEQARLSPQETAQADAILEAARVHAREIDACIDRHLTPRWKSERLQGNLTAVLRTGCAELLYVDDAKPGTVINHCLEICKRFCGDSAVKICNAVLDRAWKSAFGKDSA